MRLRLDWIGLDWTGLASGRSLVHVALTGRTINGSLTVQLKLIFCLPPFRRPSSYFLWFFFLCFLYFLKWVQAAVCPAIRALCSFFISLDFPRLRWPSSFSSLNVVPLPLHLFYALLFVLLATSRAESPISTIPAWPDLSIRSAHSYLPDSPPFAFAFRSQLSPVVSRAKVIQTELNFSVLCSPREI